MFLVQVSWKAKHLETKMGYQNFTLTNDKSQGHTCDTKGVIIAPIRATALQQPRPRARTTVG